jgi:hypothetical protein
LNEKPPSGGFFYYPHLLIYVSLKLRFRLGKEKGQLGCPFLF